MKASLPLVVLLLALATQGSASFLEDLLGFDCVDKEKGGECNAINKPCCGEDQCYFPGGYNVRSALKGECRKCVALNLHCQRNNQCCQPDPDDRGQVKVKCQKEHPGHMNGRCLPMYRAGTQCYKDSQCASDNCDKERFWHMYGTCTPARAQIN